MIEVRGLVKRFGYKTVLRGLNFQAAPGEFVALMGPNGAGKTTFLRVLATLARPSLGEVRVGGLRLPAQASIVRRLVGVVLDQPLLYGDLTAEENLRYYGRLYGVPDLEARVGELLERVGLTASRRQRVRTFSRGMWQRLAIARALLNEPPLLLLDEPYSGLDPAASERLNEVLQTQAAAGRTILMTSHDLARARALATRLDILAGGVIAASASPDGLGPGDLEALYREATGG